MWRPSKPLSSKQLKESKKSWKTDVGSRCGILKYPVRSEEEARYYCCRWGAFYQRLDKAAGNILKTGLSRERDFQREPTYRGLLDRLELDSQAYEVEDAIGAGEGAMFPAFLVLQRTKLILTILWICPKQSLERALAAASTV